MKLLAITKDYYLKNILPREKAMKENPKAFIDLLGNVRNSRLLTIKNGIGYIAINGELGNDIWSETQYSDIIESLKEAEQNEEVKEVVLEMNTPGGYVDGVIPVVEAIRNFKKPISARAGYLIASAGYWIASATNKIVATTNIAMFGSIGVIVSYYDDKEYLEKLGVKEIILTSENAPDKYTDPATTEGQKKIIDRLNKVHTEFASSVAKGRGKTIDEINSTFGKGDVLFSEDALKIGMIDEISTTTTLEETNTMEMTQEQLNKQIAEAKAEAKQEMLADIKKHFKFLGKVSNEKIVANIENQKSFLDCSEDYYEEALQNELKKARIEAGKENEEVTAEDTVDKEEHQEEEKEKLDVKKMEEMATNEFFI